MKVKSIVIDCPVLFRGSVTSIEEVHAPELNYYVNGITYNEAQSHLIVVDCNNEQYVIDSIGKKFNRRDKLTK